MKRVHMIGFITDILQQLEMSPQRQDSLSGKCSKELMHLSPPDPEEDLQTTFNDKRTTRNSMLAHLSVCDF